MSGHCYVVMSRIQILLLVALPLCAAQFRIQGPSDGNRRAQGLKYDREKGIEYDDQRASLGTGDFTIQGASDGNSDLTIQGASDGNSDFQIHGATDANAQFHIQGATDSNANFQIHSATDGHSQSAIQGPYDANQESGRALQYQDPSGFSVNWKSYQHAAQAQPPQPGARGQIQHAEPATASAPVPRRKAQRQRYQGADAPVAQAPPTLAKNPNFKVFDKAPPQIQQLLQFQQQIPYLNIIPQQYRYDFHNSQDREQVQSQLEPDTPLPTEQPVRSQYRGKSRGHARQKRQTQPRRQRQQQQQHPQHQQAPTQAEPQPPRHSNVPSRIQELLQFQAQIPYINHIPEPWRYEALLKQEGQHQNAQYQRQPEPEPVRHSQRVRQRRAAQHQPQQQPDLSQYRRISQPPTENLPHYKTSLPKHLQQLLKFQAQTPYTSVIPDQFKYEKLAAAQTHQQHRQTRQAPRYSRQHQPQQQFDLSQYQRIPQPQAEQLPQYSSNLPGSIKQLLQFQSQVPYDIIANKINVRLDKPYVPQAIPAAPVAQYHPQPQILSHQLQNQPASVSQSGSAAQSQYHQPQRPVYPSPLEQSQYQQPQQTQQPIHQPTQVPQSNYQQPQQLLGPIGQLQSASHQQYPQYNQQSQIIRPIFHPNQIPQSSSPQYPRSPYESAQNSVRPVTENQY